MNMDAGAAPRAELLLIDAADRERYEVLLAEDGTMVALLKR